MARGYVFSGGSLPPGIRALLISNIAIFLLTSLTQNSRLGAQLEYYFALIPAAVVTRLFVWQLVTYMFLHAGIFHILFNMLALWMFGCEIERLWGTKRFLQFYFFCGIGAGICAVILNYIFRSPATITVGASGAIYGILLATAVLWPDRMILFMFLFPMKMKFAVMIYGAIAFYSSFGANTGVSEFAHLGGMLFGYVFLKMPKTRGFDPMGSLREAYRRYKLERAKKKFQVYLRKKGSGQGPWVN